MAEFKLGRLKFWWKGVWQTGHAYVKDDVVRYGGKSYVCLGAHTSGINDESFYTSLDTAPFKWELMQDGISWKGAWTTGTYYKEGDIVKYGSDSYIAVDGHTAAADFWDDEASNWNNFVNGVELEGDWSSASKYQVGDIVRYGGNTYLAKRDNENENPETATADWGIFVHGFKWLGTYNPATSYHRGDVVKYSTSSYVNIQSVMGTSPAADLANAFWAAVAQGDLSVNLTTAGDLLIHGPSAIQRLPAGASNTLLQVNEFSGIPEWVSDVHIPGDLVVEGDASVLTGSVYQGPGAGDQVIDTGIDDVTADIVTMTKSPVSSGSVTITYSLGSVLTGAANTDVIEFVDIPAPNAGLNSKTWTIDSNNIQTRTLIIIDTTAAGLSGTGAVSRTAATITLIGPDAFNGLTNASGVFVGGADDFVQLALKNTVAGGSASTDLIAYANNGDNLSGWIDVGITSSGFSNPDFTVTGGNDGYIFMSAPEGSIGKGDLIIGTADTGSHNDIIFFTDGFDAANVKLQLIGVQRPETDSLGSPTGNTLFPGVVIAMDTVAENWDEGALRVQGGAGIQGNLVTFGDLRAEGGVITQGSNAKSLTEDDYPVVGRVGLTDASIIATGDEDAFVQMALKNFNTGASASTDLILYSSAGDNDSGWIDMGICSENYDDPTFGVTGKGDGYIFMSAKDGSVGEEGNLFVSTSGNGIKNDIVFSTGGFADGSFERMRIIGTSRAGHASGVEIYSSTNSTSTITGALRVQGGIGLQGNLYVGGNVNINGNTTIQGAIVIAGGSTTLSSQNLAVSDAMIFTGDGNAADGVDLGIVGSYRVAADSFTPVTLSGATATAATETVYITKTAHGFTSLDNVTITGATYAPYNKTYAPSVITIIDADNISVTGATGGVHTGPLTGITAVKGTFVNGLRYEGLTRDHNDGIFKLFTNYQVSNKPSTVITYSATQKGTLDVGDLYATNLIGSGTFTTTSHSLAATFAGTAQFNSTVGITGITSITNATAATSAVTGALKVTGGVGISGALHVTAASFFYNDITSWYSSDRRLKDNLAPITGALDKISQIGGYTFDWKPAADKNEAHDVGVIAQEVQVVLPEVVVERENGYLAVNYEKLIPLLIQGIKELQEEVNVLKAQLK